MGKEAPKEPNCICTPKKRQFYQACVAQWAFTEVLNLFDDWKAQKMTWNMVLQRVRAWRDSYVKRVPNAYAIRPEPIAEYIQSIELFSTPTGSKNRLEMCKAVLNDPQHAEYHGAVRKAQLMILEKRPLPPDLENMVTRLYRICRD